MIGVASPPPAPEEAGRRRLPSGDAVLYCDALVKRYADVTAVDGLDLEVRRGECFGLLGPNGAGKTTTVEILEGLIEPTSGWVEVLGKRWGDGQDQRLRERLGIQLQQTEFSDLMKVEETIRLFRSFYRQGRTVDEVVRLVGLDEKRTARVDKLSGGQKQRLSLACALVGDPDVLFLDEPTTGLDPRARLQIWKVVESFRSEGGTVLLTTHYMEEAARLCDRLAILNHGEVIALGTPADLIASLGAEQVVQIEIDGELETGALEALPGVLAVDRRGSGFAFGVSEIAVALPALLSELKRRDARLESMIIHHASLEDVYIQLTGRALSGD